MNKQKIAENLTKELTAADMSSKSIRDIEKSLNDAMGEISKGRFSRLVEMRLEEVISVFSGLRYDDDKYERYYWDVKRIHDSIQGARRRSDGYRKEIQEEADTLNRGIKNLLREVKNG